MEHGEVEGVRQHLQADASYQQKMIRFIENHDEPRAAVAFPDGKGRASAVAMLTLCGARLVHEGQCEGRQVRLPVFLGRRPVEAVDHELAAFYAKLLGATQPDVFRNGQWRLCACSGWADNASCLAILAWCWELGDERRLVVINYGQRPAQAQVHLPWTDFDDRQWRFKDLLSDDCYVRSGSEMHDAGLYVDLAPWKFHLFAVQAY